MRVRSPKYPSINLREAIERAQEFFVQEHHAPANVAVAAKHWGIRPTSSNLPKTISALKEFGLMADSGSKSKREVKLTDLACRILLDEREHSEERDAAIKSSALTPVLHRKIFKVFNGQLPSNDSLRYRLLTDWTPRFNVNSVDVFLKQFYFTLQFAKINEIHVLPDNEREDESAAEQTSFEGSNMKTTQAESPIEVPLGVVPTQDLANASVRRDLFSLQEGQVVVEWPSTISESSAEDIVEWLCILERKIKRTARVNAEVSQPAKGENHVD